MFEHRDTVSGKGSELTPCMGVSMYTNSTAVLLTENVDQQKVRETESKAHFIFFIFSSFLLSSPPLHSHTFIATSALSMFVLFGMLHFGVSLANGDGHSFHDRLSGDGRR